MADAVGKNEEKLFLSELSPETRQLVEQVQAPKRSAELTVYWPRTSGSVVRRMAVSSADLPVGIEVWPTGDADRKVGTTYGHVHDN